MKEFFNQLFVVENVVSLKRVFAALSFCVAVALAFIKDVSVVYAFLGFSSVLLGLSTVDNYTYNK